jgi:ABC-type Fe3+/spermidine/putrescine transport system ATPase subunit
VAVKSLDLEIRAGGPSRFRASGCGKTTTLRMARGATQTRARSRWRRGHHAAAAYRRPVNTVSSPTAVPAPPADNVAFGLVEEKRRGPRSNARRRDAELVQLAGRSLLAAGAARRQHSASRWREALVNPKVLLDEPLGGRPETAKELRAAEVG